MQGDFSAGVPYLIRTGCSPYLRLMDEPDFSLQQRVRPSGAAKEKRPHRVLMIFNANHTRTSWEIVFRKPPTPRPLPRVLHFGDPEKIRDLYRRFGADRLSEDVQALEFALSQGHGIAVLLLGDEQFNILQQVT